MTYTLDHTLKGWERRKEYWAGRCASLLLEGRHLGHRASGYSFPFSVFGGAAVLSGVGGNHIFLSDTFQGVAEHEVDATDGGGTEPGFAALGVRSAVFGQVLFSLTSACGSCPIRF